MGVPWSSSADLLLDVDASAGTRKGIEQALRAAIRDGRLRPGSALPSSRALAADLGIARGTVSAAYAQLAAEGYLIARQGAASRVAAISPSPRRPPAPAPPPGPRWDLRPGRPDIASFPRAAWARAARQVYSEFPAEALGYGGTCGRPELRDALADYLGRARGVLTDRCAPLLVCDGFSQALTMICLSLRAAGARRLGVEDPSSPRYRRVAAECGLEVIPLRCDDDGMDTRLLNARPLDAVLVTPAHQFPLGGTMSFDRRGELIDWARRRGRLVIEDDYDGEFRFDRHPVGVLQQLDPEHVVYVGSASKTLAPGLRLGWLTMPPVIADGILDVKERIDRGHSVFDQLILARLIATGELDRHVRRMRAAYRRRRDELVTVVGGCFPEVVISGVRAGLHAVLSLPDGHPGADEEVIAALAARHDIGLDTLRRYWHAPGTGQGGAATQGSATTQASAATQGSALVVGFGTPPAHAYQATLAAFAEFLADLRDGQDLGPRRASL